jgi:hypothetical protein
MIKPQLRRILLPFLHPDLFGTYVLAAVYSTALGLVYALGFGCFIRAGGFLFLGPTLIVSWVLVLTAGAFQGWLWRRVAKPAPPATALKGAKLVAYSFLAMTLMLFSSMWIGAEIREVRARQLCRRVEPLVARLQQEKNRTGNFPTNLRAFVRTNAPEYKKLLFYYGETNGVDWLPNRVAGSDVTLLAVSNQLECVVPIERMSPISFSSFQVFAFTSDHPRWFKTRLHWSLLGAYIDPPGK